MNEMQKRVLEYIQKEYIEDDTEVELNTPLISGGIVDSFSMVSLKRFLETKYHIQIPDEAASPDVFDNVTSICKLVEEYIQKKG